MTPQLFNRVRSAVRALSKNETTRNSSRNDATDFLRYGSKRPMFQDWSQVEISDKDMYTGYSYAAIKKRANRASALGKKFLYTEASPAVMDQAKEQDKGLEHPYLKLIRKSKDFTTRKFWHDISTYLDLEGVYYLMAVRAVSQNRDGSPKVGAVQKFVMMNPYEVRRVLKGSTNELGGYVEAHDGMYREIPKEMVIEIRLLNPFNNDLPYSMTDAAKESQFTLKQAGDYTRHSIKGNINTPGAITTDVELEDNVFDNFISRINNHTKGEPLYGNGAGAIKWESMQIDLDKAALDKINEIHRSVLFAVSGTSKTTLGIEESGTTRDTSQVQKDNFTEDAVMPQVEDVIDALNLDYRRYYPEWEKDEYNILLDNPLESDREAELKDIEIRESELNLRDALVAKGYDYEIASKYAHGDISLEELGEPTIVEESEEEVEEKVEDNGDEPTPKTEEDQQPESTPKNMFKSANQLASRDLPNLYDGIELDMDKLGCIMIDTEKIPVTQYVDVKHAGDIYYEGNHSGIAGETEPHTTLLYGLMENGNVWKDKVDMVLDGWKMPTVTIKEVSYFDLGESYCIVGLLEQTPELVDGHERLTLLPHVSTFSEYIPHISLVYINHDANPEDWVKPLAKKYNGQKVATKTINYGDMPTDGQDETDNHVEDEHDMSKNVRIPSVFVKDTKKSKEVDNDLSDDKHTHEHEVDNSFLVRVNNELDPIVKDQVVLQEANLERAVANLDNDIVKAVIEALRNGDRAEAERLIAEAQEESFIQELALIFAAYYTVLFPVYAAQLMSLRLKMFSTQGVFTITDEIKLIITETSQKAATSHVNTILGDIKKIVDTAEESVTTEELIKLVQDGANTQNEDYLKLLPENPKPEDIVEAVKDGKFNDQPVYKTARDLAGQGEGLREIERTLQREYSDVSAKRAKVIAKTESARVFNVSQYEADRQFLVESGNMTRAYKRLRSRTGDPCPVCALLIAKTALKPIPFEKNFADLGDELTASYKKPNGKTAVQKMPINYEPIKSGNVHPLCNCEYELVLKQDDGTFLNKFDPSQPRDDDGKWTGGGVDSVTGMGKVDLSNKSQMQKDAESMSRFDFIDKYLPSSPEPENFTKFLARGVKGEPTDDKEAIDEILTYQGSGFNTINKYLASHPDEELWNSTYKRLTKSLDKAFSWETTKGVEVYRKLSKDYYDINKVGQKFTEPNYGSTSLNPGEANQSAWGDGPILIIDVPKGQKVAIPDLYSNDPEGISIFSQQEILLPRSTTYEVLEIITMPEMSHERLVRVRIVDNT